MPTVPPAAPISFPPPPRRADGSRPVILVVDDEPTITRMLELMLGKLLDAEIVVANRSFGLLNIVADRRPDVVLLDLMMPGLDGAAVTALIRGDQDLSRTRVLLHSALDEPSLQRRVAECRADGYIPKGLRPTEIARRVAEVLSSESATRG